MIILVDQIIDGGGVVSCGDSALCTKSMEMFDFLILVDKKVHIYINYLPIALRVVEWVALIRFLFGMWHYQSTLDFAFLF